MIEAIELTSIRRPRGPGGGAVDKVSFDVYPGQVTALLGAPGAGKSTVLRMMVEVEPGGGRTLFGGRPYRALRPAVREVGLALNPDALHPGRTVQAHLQLYSAAGGVPKARIAEVLEVAGLATQTAVRCGRLDAGQRQRLAIAAALLGDPSALILDEPYALDSHGMSWFHALIRAYAAQGRTVLVAATDPDSLAGTADHVVVLRRDDEDGLSRVIASRSAAEVFDERRATVIQVRSPQAARLAAALETEGARLSAAGPGALQVRGLDRARIGEVAHGAGICLHELSEIGHDDDVFGLRPVPRQKELVPELVPAEAEVAEVEVGDSSTSWTSGVRLVSVGAVPAEAEAEKPEVAGTAGTSPDTAVIPSADIETQAIGSSEAVEVAEVAEVVEAAEAAEAATQATVDAETSQPETAPSQVVAVEATTPPDPARPDSPRHAANHAVGTFRRGGGRRIEATDDPVVVEATSTPAPFQPAVPFTVAAAPAAPAADSAASAASTVTAAGADDGMTPWRAVAARAARQQHDQGSAAEAAPAEQEASA